MELTGLVVAKARPKPQPGQQAPDGVVVDVHIQPTPGTAAYTIGLLLPRSEARTLDIDDEVRITVERVAAPAPAEGA